MEASATEEGKGIVLVQFHLMMYKFRRKKPRTGSEKKHPCLLTVRDSSVVGQSFRGITISDDLVNFTNGMKNTKYNLRSEEVIMSVVQNYI